MSVTSSLQREETLSSTRESKSKRSSTNVMSVTISLQIEEPFSSTEKSIMQRTLISVMSVKRSFHREIILSDIRNYTVERSLINVVCVTSSLAIYSTLPSSRESIPRDYTAYRNRYDLSDICSGVTHLRSQHNAMIDALFVLWVSRTPQLICVFFKYLYCVKSIKEIIFVKCSNKV